MFDFISISALDSSVCRLQSFIKDITSHFGVIDMAGNAQCIPSVVKFTCTNCSGPNPKSFNSVRGLRIHNTKCHPNAPAPRINTNGFGEIFVSDGDNVSEDDFLKLYEFKAKFGVLKRIPKGARPQAAQAYIRLVRACISANDLPSWFNSFIEEKGR